MMSMISALCLTDHQDAEKFLKTRRVTGESLLALLEETKANVPADEQQTARREMEKHLKRFAPEWLEEFAVTDELLSLPAGTALELLSYANYVADKYECTSWITMPDITANGHVMLHKNRDSPQTAHAPVFVHTPGRFLWAGSCTHALAYPFMGINEKGLAIAVNNGEICRKWNHSGLTTQMILRLMLERCSTPREAEDLLEEIRKAGAYSHGKTGSIFFYANAETAGITEMCAERSIYLGFDFGYMIRSNAWHLPGMTAMSLASTNSIAATCTFRECIVRDGLHRAMGAGGITPEDCFAITRDRTLGVTPEVMPVCRDKSKSKSNSFGTFELDPEFPELSIFYHGCGPSRNTICIPVPFGANAFPEEMFSGDWTQAGWDFYALKGIDHTDLNEINALEKELCRQNALSIEEARLLLRSGENGRARQVLAAQLEKSFASAAELMKKLCVR